MLVCLLCDSTLTKPARLCDRCYQELPWNQACCRRCAQPLTRSQPTCQRCEHSDWSLSMVLAPLRYEFPIDRLLLKSKAGKRPDLLPTLATLLLPLARQRLLDCRQTARARWLVPIPLSSQRQHERGFNQSALIANYLGRRLGIGVAHDALLRRHEHSSQKSRTLPERQRALRRAFQINSAWYRRLQHSEQLILIDDVVTSGQTLLHAASAVRALDCGSIEAWTVAATAAQER